MSKATPSPFTKAAIAASKASYPFDNVEDFDDATKGFIARRTERQITSADGRVVWDLDAYEFLADPAPETADTSLWRQGQLLIKDGLFEVTPGIYQLRGFDLSVMSVIEGESGVIVVDPLICAETAEAAFSLYSEHRGARPVVAVIYSHSHIDHFGGVKGVTSQEDVDAGRTQIIAPVGFLQAAISENVYAGPAMARRAGYMYGASLTKGPADQIGSGLGQTTSTGRTTLIRPTIDITSTGQEVVIDGVRIIFQLTPGTEAPAEMNFYFPDHRALCTAENTSHTLHNILTIRGAQVRDAHGWAHYLTETIDLFGGDLDLVFASHHWPTWGRERAVEFLAMQRDMYLYLHDQTLRLMNEGYVGAEIAEVLEMPPALAEAWHTHGYYGSVSHNVKAIYQRYMGWYDANPANLWPHPPVEAAKRYMEAMGGPEAALAIAQSSYDEGDYRWTMEVCKHIVFSGSGEAGASALMADAFEQVAFATENGTWRNAFLSGARELRDGVFGTPAVAGSLELLTALSVDQLLDAMAGRIDGPRAWDEHLVLSFVIADLDTTYIAELRHGVLHHRVASSPASGSLTITIGRERLIMLAIGLMIGLVSLDDAMADGTFEVDGDPAVLLQLVGLLSAPNPAFNIVTS
jgi:alkyl sulfatase BDS1-like metallo-beta-lactamase superfamily hydrolase